MTNEQKATVSLVGETKTRFDIVRDYMVDRMPGITPNSADVIRHALYLAVDRIECAATYKSTPVLDDVQQTILGRLAQEAKKDLAESNLAAQQEKS